MEGAWRLDWGLSTWSWTFGAPDGKRRLHQAHRKTKYSKVWQYIVCRVIVSIKLPIMLALASNLVAVFVDRVEHTHYLRKDTREVFEQLWDLTECVKGTLIRCYLASFLGFFTGFYLNNAFQRNTKGLEHVQQLSVQLRTGADVCLDVLARANAAPLSDELQRARAVVAWVKLYFIQACRGLNSIALRSDHSKLCRTMARWDLFLGSQVRLSETTLAVVQAHSDVFVSSLQMELVWWRWLTPVLQLVPAGQNPPPELAEARRRFETARASFHAAHLIANGVTSSPIMAWLLGGLMYVFCVALPWLIVQSFGVWSLVPTFFTTCIYFGARQVLCEQLDNMLELFSQGHYAPLDIESGCSSHFRLVTCEPGSPKRSRPGVWRRC